MENYEYELNNRKKKKEKLRRNWLGSAVTGDNVGYGLLLPSPTCFYCPSGHFTVFISPLHLLPFFLPVSMQTTP